jgi:hypothetical protein
MVEEPVSNGQWDWRPELVSPEPLLPEAASPNLAAHNDAPPIADVEKACCH